MMQSTDRREASMHCTCAVTIPGSQMIKLIFMTIVKEKRKTTSLSVLGKTEEKERVCLSIAAEQKHLNLELSPMYKMLFFAQTRRQMEQKYPEC